MARTRTPCRGLPGKEPALYKIQQVRARGLIHDLVRLLVLLDLRLVGKYVSAGYTFFDPRVLERNAKRDKRWPCCRLRERTVPDH